MERHPVAVLTTMGLDFTVDAAWATGLFLALTRVAAYVIAAPQLAKALPVPGRLAFVVGIASFLAAPVPGVTTLADLFGVAFGNIGVGIALGFLTGILFQAFVSAGGLVDVTSNLSVSAVFDPTQGQQAAVFGRIVHHTATALLVVTGGLGVLAVTLVWSVEAVPLGVTPAADPDLATLATRGLASLMVLAVELALPVLGGLFLVELALGVASRFAPQAQVFLIGLPAKILLSFVLVGATVLMLPGAVSSYLEFVRDTAVAVLQGLTPAA